MPQLADITAKNAAAVNTVFKGLVPASGDTPALWRAQSVAPVPAAQPSMTVSHRRNADRSAQKLIGVITVPLFVTDSVTGKVTVAGSIPFNFTATKPDNAPDAFAADYAAYVQSLIGSTLFKDMLINGFSAT